MKILFACCGSAGHIAPCVAVWRAVRELRPDATAHVACSNTPEDARFLEKEGMEYTAVGSRNVTIMNILPGLLRSWRLLGRIRPDAVFTKGGGVTIPIALAAWMRRIPIVVHESDAVPGRATRFLSHFAALSIDGFSTGNPLRPGINQGSREKGLRLTGMSGDRPILLVTGGSQGAQTFNDAIIAHVDELLDVVDVIHITGQGKRGVEVAKAGYWKSPFVHEDLAHLYAAADIALSRAGSGNIGELAANRIPAILIPLEGLAQNHQVANAKATERSGGCIVLMQEHLDRDLVSAVRALAMQPDRRAAMSTAIAALAKPDAARRIAEELLSL